MPTNLTDSSRLPSSCSHHHAAQPHGPAIISALLQGYLDKSVLPGTVCLKGDLTTSATGILNYYAYAGMCSSWRGEPWHCPKRSRCPHARSHVWGVPTVLARLMYRLPLDERPEVQVRHFVCVGLATFSTALRLCFLKGVLRVLQCIGRLLVPALTSKFSQRAGFSHKL